ncbi:histidine phosphatase family protein [Porticoccus sp. GXU_MW_L64]
MPQITLVRHGQASFGSDNYDQLTELGGQQATYLGQHFKQQQKEFDLLVTGTMVRHKQTAVNVLNGLSNSPEEIENDGFNEYDFQDLLTAFQKQYPDEVTNEGSPQSCYYRNITRALGYWMEGHLAGTTISWQYFRQQVIENFQAVSNANKKQVLIVTSGGPISVMLGHALGLKNESVRNMSLQIRNSSKSTLLYNRQHFTLDCFNCIGHLEHSGNSQAITYL